MREVRVTLAFSFCFSAAVAADGIADDPSGFPSMRFEMEMEMIASNPIVIR